MLKILNPLRFDFSFEYPAEWQYRPRAKETGVRVQIVNRWTKVTRWQSPQFSSQFSCPLQIWKYQTALFLSIVACNSYRCRITAAPASRRDFISSARLAPKRRHYRKSVPLRVYEKGRQLQPPIDPHPRRCASGISRKNSRQGETSTPRRIKAVVEIIFFRSSSSSYIPLLTFVPALQDRC